MVSPGYAYRHAHKNGGSDRLRFICCKDPDYAYLYALAVDKVPREDTREAACKSLNWAYYYAKDIDKGYHEETRRSCYKSTYYYGLYLEEVLKSKYYEELKLFQYMKRINNGTRRSL